jgi:hypothetical protein
MRKFIEIGNASKDCPYCYSDGEFVVCTESPKCKKTKNLSALRGKITKQNEGEIDNQISDLRNEWEQPNLSSVIKNVYDSIEKTLIDRLTLIGVDVNEAPKRITRIVTQKSNIVEFRHEFWIDYNAANRELLFVVHHDFEKGIVCFNFNDVTDIDVGDMPNYRSLP